MAEAVYLLCAVTSLLCAVLLLASYRRTRVSLTLWTALCFAFLALNNVLLFLDLVVILDVNMRLLRNVTGVAGVAVLLYGMITAEALP